MQCVYHLIYPNFLSLILLALNFKYNLYIYIELIFFRILFLYYFIKILKISKFIYNKKFSNEIE